MIARIRRYWPSLGALFILASIPVLMAATYTFDVRGTATSGGGGTTQCDIGPPYTGAIPAAATQAGFTHCYANYDFTVTSSWTDNLGTHQWSNLSSWFGCGQPNNGSLLFFAKDPCDTGHVNITSDGGTQVLALTWSLSDAPNGYIPIASAWCCTSGVTGTVGSTFPESGYIEVTRRRTATTGVCSPTCIMDAFNNGAPDGSTGTNPCYYALDPDESYSGTGNNINSGIMEWNANCGSSGSTFGPGLGGLVERGTSYGTYGFLWTADGVSQTNMCSYSADGSVRGLTASSFFGCMTPFDMANPTTALFTKRLYVGYTVGPQGNYPNATAGWSYYFPRMTYWTCNNGPTSTCFNNPVITTHP